MTMPGDNSIPQLLLPRTVLSLMIVTLLLFMQGCSEPPLIETKQLASDSSEFSLLLKIHSSQQLSAKQIQVRLFNKYDLSMSYSLSLKQDETETNQFIITTNNLPDGNYRLAVDAPGPKNLLGIPLGHSLQTVFTDIVVHKQLKPSCFKFNDKKKDVMGWKTSHVYQGNKELPASSPTCPGLFWVNTSWPLPLNQTSTAQMGGSLFVPISSECFPKTSNKLSDNPKWMFSITSPDLTELTDWQTIKEINFRVAGKNISFFVTPEVHFNIGKKLSSTFEQNTPRQIYEILSNHWQEISHPLDLPNEAVITNIVFHISGVPEQTVGEGVNSIFLDGICPGSIASK